MASLNLSACRAWNGALGQREHLVNLKPDILRDDAPACSRKFIWSHGSPDFHSDDHLIAHVVISRHCEGNRALSQIGNPAHDGFLDQVRMYVCAAAYDHILDAARDIELTVKQEAQVSRVE